MFSPKVRVVTFACGLAAAVLLASAGSSLAQCSSCGYSVNAPAVAAPVVASSGYTTATRYWPLLGIYTTRLVPYTTYSSPYAASYTPYAASYTPYATAYTPYVASYTPYVVSYTPYVASYTPYVAAYSPCNSRSACSARGACGACGACSSCGCATVAYVALSLPARLAAPVCSSCAVPACASCAAPACAATNAAAPSTYKAEKPEMKPIPEAQPQSLPLPSLGDPADRVTARPIQMSSRVSLMSLSSQELPVGDDPGWRPAKN